jgi:hypothetical protein
MREEIIKIYKSNRNYYKKHLLDEHFTFLNESFNWTNKLIEQLYCLRFEITEQPKCGYSKCDKFANFKGMTEGYGVGGCCRLHGQIISNLSKHGYEMPFLNKNVIEKTIETFKKNWGVDNPMKNSAIARKTSETRKNYNVEQKQQYLNRRSETCKEKFGFENIFQDIKFIEDKVYEKYGVRNIAQADIERKNNGIPKSKIKNYQWKTGEISKVQGYEDTVLRELEEEGFSYEDVKTRKCDMPPIWYFDNEGIKRRYYSDFFIPMFNLIIEVKSTYTLMYDFDNNIVKRLAAEKAGYKFLLEIR